MEKNLDVGKILLKINSQCYEKGMKNIPIPVHLKGIRKGKITEIDRKIIIPQIVKSKEYDIFEKQFLKNIDDEIQDIARQDKVRKIVKDPKINFYTYEDCDEAMLYLYLLSLNDEKYDGILKELLESVCNEKKLAEDTKKAEIQSLKETCKKYEKEIEQLKIISRQRKEKIKELEIRSNILDEELEKLKIENNQLKIQVEEREKQIEKQIEKYENRNTLVTEKKESKRNKIVVIGKELSLANVQEKVLDKILLEEFSEELLHIYDIFLIIKKNISIGKLRKLKNVLGNRGIFCENNEEVSNYIIKVEGKYENRGD